MSFLKQLWKRCFNHGFLSKTDAKKRRWSSHLHDEAEFWEDLYGGKHPQFEQDMRDRLNPEAAFPLELRERIAESSIQDNCIRILDVGAGPLTILGKQWDPYKLEITAVDPLADAYTEILENAGVEAPVRTQQGEAERLVELFGENRFDFVFSRNALDHSYDALEAIRQCVRVAKPNAPVVLWHFRNEAESQGYKGLHQWNFSHEAGSFIIWNKSERINVTRNLEGLAKVQFDRIKSDWLDITIRKPKASRA